MSEQENALVEKKTFQEKMADRMREGIGDLMSDEEIKKLVERGIEEVYFTSYTTMGRDRYSGRDRTIRHEAIIPTLAKEIYKDIVTEKAREYLKEKIGNSEDLDAFMRVTIDEIFYDCFKKLVAEILSESMNQMKFSLINQIQNGFNGY